MADITTKAQLYYPGAGNASSDFIGFSFNGVTHTQLGISRVSDGSRYNEEMLPSFQDKSAQMPGSDYTLYWESFYSIKTWSLQIAFDHMTDQNMQLFRRTFNTKNLAPLTFDERPNIHWLAKVQSPPQLKYICFDENNTKVYKGEGTINFIAYYPFGMGTLNTKSNIASEIITNDGDIPMDWYVVLSKARAKQLEQLKLEITEVDGGATVSANIITFDTSGLNSNVTDNYVVINSKTNLIEGATSYSSSNGTYVASGKVYNQYITSGDFFQIPVSDVSKTLTFYITGPTGSTRNLHYRYLYL